MQTTEGSTAPGSRGIHRRADFARTHAADEAERDRRHAAIASIFVFVLSITILEPISQWAIGTALALLVQAVLNCAAPTTTTQRSSKRATQWAPTIFLAICTGQWAAVGGMLPAGLIWALWLPALAHSRKASLLWSAALALPVLWSALPASPATATGVVMAIGVGGYASDLIGQLRMRRAEAVFDTDESNAVILTLQSALRPILDTTAAENATRWSEQAINHAYDIVIAVDDNQHILHTNGAAQSALRKPAEELAGTPLANHVDWLEPSSRKPRPPPKLCDTVAGQNIGIDDALLTVLPDGPELNVDGHLRGMYDPVLGKIGVFTLRNNS
jgi:PAS domain-containing protein